MQLPSRSCWPSGFPARSGGLACSWSSPSGPVTPRGLSTRIAVAPAPLPLDNSYPASARSAYSQSPTRTATWYQPEPQRPGPTTPPSLLLPGNASLDHHQQRGRRGPARAVLPPTQQPVVATPAACQCSHDIARPVRFAFPSSRPPSHLGLVYCSRSSVST